MSSLVEKFTGRKFVPESSATYDRAMFGSGRDMSKALETTALRPAHRIGLWPILSSTEPEVAMGLGVTLAVLLERFQSVRVYRLLARLEDEATEDYQWSITDSQYGVDDWILDGLDENAALWGQLEKASGRWMLRLELEDDLSESDEVMTFSREAESVAGLVAMLPELAEEVADALSVTDTNPLDVLFDIQVWSDATVQSLLKVYFRWELNLLLDMWGLSWSVDSMWSAYDELTSLVGDQQADLFAWVAAHATARALFTLNETVIGEAILPEVETMAEELRVQPSAGVILSAVLMRLRYPLRAYDVLEDSVSAHPDHSASYLALGELYRQGNDVVGMVDAYQRAIEREVDTVEIDMHYADLLLFMDAASVNITEGAVRQTASGREYVEGFVFIEAGESQSQPGHDEDGNSYLVLEAVQALQSALKIDPDHVEGMGQLALHQIDLRDPAMWDTFETLVEKDDKGELTRMVVDAFYNLEDCEPGIVILEAAVEAQPKRADLRINLAVGLLQIEDSEGAHQSLDVAARLVDDDLIRADIERLRLTAEAPDFEAHFGEITDLVNAGSNLSAEDVEFLEDLLDRAPLLAEVYTFLASAYLHWDERDDALNVLLDGQKLIPHNPEITMALAKMLWEADENDLAFEYLNKGLEHNPQHAGLLATTGRYLFEDGQDAAAKEFLLRAEAINPRHSALIEARELIARSQNNKN